MIYSRRVVTLFDDAVQWDILHDTVQLLQTPAAPGHARARRRAGYLGGPGLPPAAARVALGAASLRFGAAPGEDDIAALVGHTLAYEAI